MAQRCSSESNGPLIQSEGIKASHGASLLAPSIALCACRAEDLIVSLPDNSIHLILTDPPYFNIIGEKWDRAWSTSAEYSGWLSNVLLSALPKLADDGSLVVFQGIGKHGQHPIFDVVSRLEHGGYFFRHWVTWKKRRAYGKEFDYLFTREEILWFSKSPERTSVRFNKPYTDVLRGYDGFSEKYKAKSDFKRVGSVIDHITELFKTEREAQKPVPLMELLIKTHSHEGDLVVDPFVGWGTTAIAARNLKRRFSGCDIDSAEVERVRRRLA